jgi:hypothetical protein
MDLNPLLDDVAQWRLTSNGWQRVDEALVLLDEAMESGDEERVREGMTALVLAGPRRAGKRVDDTMDQPARHPASARTRDLANRLLRRIGPPQRDAPDSAPSGRDDDATA